MSQTGLPLIQRNEFIGIFRMLVETPFDSMHINQIIEMFLFLVCWKGAEARQLFWGFVVCQSNDNFH